MPIPPKKANQRRYHVHRQFAASRSIRELLLALIAAHLQ